MEKEVIESEKKTSELKHIPLELLDDFPNHPFKVRDDEDMLELIESVTERGVLVPAMVRPKANGRYELISGHRRKRASECVGKDTLQCFVKDLDDMEAVIIAAPYGYIVDKTPIIFDITAENATIEDALTIVKVEKANTAQKGTITVTKSGEVFSDVSVSGSENEAQIYQPVFAKDTLKGAVYDVIAAEDIVTLDGTTRAKKGDIVDTITTGDNGTATSKLLYLGKYNVKERTAPYGMVLNDEIHSVELAYAGQNVEISKTATSFYNERQKAEIKFEKTMELDELFGLGNNGEVTSVTFGLYAAKELVSASGAVIPADALIEIINMDKNGKAEVKTDLPIGEYYVQEIATNNAYILNDNKYPVAFEYAGQDTAVVNLTVNDGNPIENKIIYHKLAEKTECKQQFLCNHSI